jgi:hypothetical protein
MKIEALLFGVGAVLGWALWWYLLSLMFHPLTFFQAVVCGALTIIAMQLSQMLMWLDVVKEELCTRSPVTK